MNTRLKLVASNNVKNHQVMMLSNNAAFGPSRVAGKRSCQASSLLVDSHWKPREAKYPIQIPGKTQMEQGTGGGSLHLDEPTGKQHLAKVMERMQGPRELEPLEVLLVCARRMAAT
jgi:hypothetical protein